MLHGYTFTAHCDGNVSSPSGSKGLGSKVDVSSVVVISDVSTECKCSISLYGKRKCMTQLYKSYI